MKKVDLNSLLNFDETNMQLIENLKTVKRYYEYPSNLGK
jgi:hypothetical protein